MSGVTCHFCLEREPRNESLGVRPLRGKIPCLHFVWRSGWGECIIYVSLRPVSPWKHHCIKNLHYFKPIASNSRLHLQSSSQCMLGDDMMFIGEILDGHDDDDDDREIV